ncbi:MAG: hypothetical protein IKZ44_06750 [Clostridia bacterium]|nr:hypothetical protein [Clostridia bacterium]
MVYAAYKNAAGEFVTGLYENMEKLNRDLWSPLTEVFSMIDFRVRGSSYKEKQSCLCDIARRFQYEVTEGLSWYEVSVIADWFYRMGRRFGLLKDFRENGLC